MPYLSSLAAIAVFAAQTFAAPAPQSSSSSSDSAPATNGFSVAQVAGPKYFKSGPAQVLKTYAKYNATVSPTVVTNLKVAAAALQSGSVNAAPESYDQSYLSPVKVGSQVCIVVVWTNLKANLH